MNRTRLGVEGNKLGLGWKEAGWRHWLLMRESRIHRCRTLASRGLEGQESKKERWNRDGWRGRRGS